VARLASSSRTRVSSAAFKFHFNDSCITGLKSAIITVTVVLSGESSVLVDRCVKWLARSDDPQ
jgi:hypothetical protein